MFDVDKPTTSNTPITDYAVVATQNLQTHFYLMEKWYTNRQGRI